MEYLYGLLCWLSVKNPPTLKGMWIQSLGQKIPWRRKWQSTPAVFSGESHGQRSLVGCSPWGCEESDTTEWLHFHFSLSYIGEGNGNPLQCSCLENPRDGEPAGLPSMGLHRVGHGWSDLVAAAAMCLFIISNSFLVETLEFSLYEFMPSTSNASFTSSFSIWVPLIFLLYLL